MIKIAIPTRDNAVDDHFGHCAYYTILTVGSENEIINVEMLPSPQGCGCKSNIAAVLQSRGITVMLAGNMGQGALEVLSSHNIKVFRGCSGNVMTVARDYLDGKIEDSGIGCESHECHESESVPTVYFIKEISPENLVKIYKVLGREASGKVAVKLSTGEPGNNNYLQPALIRDFVHCVNGTIIECNTAYGGGRADTVNHLKAAEDHGFTSIAQVDIMDAEGQVALPVAGGKHLKEDFVGKNYLNYDFTVVLSHFKGHPMGGFGGAIKNIAIGIASSEGKAWIHSAGHTMSQTEVWENLPPQDDFLESMAEAAKAVTDHCGDNILYISVANNLSVDCDCVATPEDPQMADIGILASLDPVALDRACVDMVRASEDPGKVHMIERIDSRNGMHTLDHAEALGMGVQKYNLVELK